MNLEKNTSSLAQPAADWLETRMQEDGSLRGGVSINEYYKVVCALACAGRVNSAERMLNYMSGRFLKDGGDLDGRGCEWFEQFRIYCHAWVALAAIQLGRLDLSEPLLDFLQRFHDAQSGGFFGNVGQRDSHGEQEMMTTGVVGIAMLWGGRTGLGKQVAAWFKRVWEAQPNLEDGLYFVWHSRRGLVKDFPGDKAVAYRVAARKPAQWYFQYGVASAFLSAYAGAARDPDALKLAQGYLQATRFFAEEAYGTPQIGKVGWGAAWTARLSQDERDLAVRDRVFASLRSSQSPEGWWPGQTTYGKPIGAGTAPSLDITGEFVALTSWMERPIR